MSTEVDGAGPDEGAGHILAIQEAEAKIEALRKEARKHRRALAKAIVAAFNKASDADDMEGMSLAPREIDWVSFSSCCAASPIGVCVYSDRVLSLPAQRGVRAASTTDCCLFCGQKGTYSAAMPGRTGNWPSRA